MSPQHTEPAAQEPGSASTTSTRRVKRPPATQPASRSSTSYVKSREPGQTASPSSTPPGELVASPEPKGAWKAAAVVAGIGLAIIPASIALVDRFQVQLTSVGRWVLTSLTVAVTVATVAVAVNALIKEKVSALRPRLRRAIVLGSMVSLGLLTLAFLGLRDPFATIPRMTGTEDIAAIGFIDSQGSALEESSDLSDSLAEHLRPVLGHAAVKSYASLNAPLDGLLQVDHGGLREWTDEFLTRSGAAIVLAGIVDHSGAQLTVRPAIYVRPASIPEAPELMDWVVGSPSIVVGGIDSARGRQSLFEGFLGSGVAVSAFVDALDAWRVGHVDEAARLFFQLPTNIAGGLLSADLVHLFRGHALELQAEGADEARRKTLLSRAAEEYRAIDTRSPLQGRAQVSLATNEYLRGLSLLCSAATVDGSLLHDSIEHLKIQIANSQLPAISRLAAVVNFAQAARCAIRAGLPLDGAALTEALATIRDFHTTDANSLAPVHRIQALGRSIEAQVSQEAGDEASAERLIQEAISLSADPSDRGRWYGLESLWQQQVCHLDEAANSMDLSLKQYEAAAKNGRISMDFLERYSRAAKASLATATHTCST